MVTICLMVHVHQLGGSILQQVMYLLCKLRVLFITLHQEHGCTKVHGAKAYKAIETAAQGDIMAYVTWTNAMALLLQSHLSDAERDIDPWVIQCCIEHRRRDIFTS
jgi:hypothetical protein